MADPLKERISLLEKGEAQGKLKPQHAAELARYRESGATKTRAAREPSPSGRQAVAGVDAPSRAPTGQAAQAAYAKVAAARSMRKQLNRARDLYDTNMSGKGVMGLREYSPFRAANQEFDGAVSAIPLLARHAFRVAGSGADSDREVKLITDALPNRWSFDTTNRERFKTLETVIGDMIGNNAGLAGYDPAQTAALRRENAYVPLTHRKVRNAPPKARRAPGRAVIDINGNPVR